MSLILLCTPHLYLDKKSTFKTNLAPHPVDNPPPFSQNAPVLVSPFFYKKIINISVSLCVFKYFNILAKNILYTIYRNIYSYIFNVQFPWWFLMFSSEILQITK